MKAAVALFSLMALAAAVLAATPADFKVDMMPLYTGPNVKFETFSGYLPASADGRKQLFFLFTTSQGSVKDPLVVWLNGGPGCSSMEGFLNENGPFVVGEKGLSLTSNDLSWNRLANVLYIESPVSVGFSYSTDKKDYKIGDAQTAADLTYFLLEFLNVFKEYNAGQPLYLTGESYAGHYVPTFAATINEYNKRPDRFNKVPINLRGVMIGNPWTDTELDNRGCVEYWKGHHIVSDATAQCMLDTCDFSHMGPLSRASTIDPVKCNKCSSQAHREMAGISIYNIYQDLCLAQSERSVDRLAKKLGRIVPDLKQEPRSPCDDQDLGYYMNRPDVQKALHVIPGNWSMCSDILDYSDDDLYSSMLPTYKYLLSQTNISITIFSGDFDAIVPWTGARNWVNALNMGAPSVEFKAWYVDQQVGGYVTEWNNINKFTFTTVRGSGHMVPSDQSSRAMFLFACRLSGQPLSTCTYKP